MQGFCKRKESKILRNSWGGVIMSIIRYRDENGEVHDIAVINGKSAYEIAVDKGFNGTEDEWLESLGNDNKWAKKKMGIIGDSQSERNAHKTSPWWQTVVSGFSGGVLKTLSGYTIANNSKSYGSFLNLAKGLSFALDAIFIMGGVNDVWFNTPMGEFGSKDNTTFYGAMDELCNLLLEKYPQQTIVFITPTEQNNDNCNSANTTGHTVADFAEAMKKVCEKYSISVYDAHSRSGIYPLNDTHAAIYTTDKLHLNDVGHKRLGEQILSFVQNECYVPEGGKWFDSIIGSTKNAYFTNDSLYLALGSTYGGVTMPGVVKMTVDMSKYTIPAVSPLGKAIGWFAFKQADGSYKGVSIYNGLFDFANEGLECLTGEKWDFDAELINPTNNSRGLWSAPAAMPKKVEVVLENETGKIYFDDTVVFSLPCVELGYIQSSAFSELVGLSLTYEQEV
ncbi:MAG: SGNH/GDSL hydrolase family protein [Ruminococcaceae bacterium]|nr:SGNH/GDSL hydrolase family protein [Oscillospiraceae bacterium]